MAVPSPNSVALVEHVGPSAWAAPRGAPTDNPTTAVESFDKLVECLFFIAAEPCRANRECAHYKGHFGAWYTALLLAAHQSPVVSMRGGLWLDGRSISSKHLHSGLLFIRERNIDDQHVTSLDIVITVNSVGATLGSDKLLLLVPGPGMNPFGGAKPHKGEVAEDAVTDVNVLLKSSSFPYLV